MMAREHFDSSCLCDNPTRTTPQLHPAPWDGEALATAFETMDELDARLRGREMRCWSCGADPEPVLYRVDGNWVCGQCALECPCCAERPAVASARRPADDPTAPNQIDMICAECLHEHWAPGETLQGAYLCLECDEWHVREQDCCACHGDGWFDRDEDTEYGAVAVAQHCDCPAGVRRYDGWLYVECPRCGTCGPTRAMLADAVAVWNSLMRSAAVARVRRSPSTSCPLTRPFVRRLEIGSRTRRQ